nr:hypothetical protein [Bacillus subtilis]
MLISLCRQSTQIISEAAKIRYRSNNDWSCPICRQERHTAEAVHGAAVSILNQSKQFSPNQPGLKIVMPSTPYDAKGLLKAASS